MTATGPLQRRRRDAGIVVVTGRDAAAVRWVGGMYGVRDDTLAVVLARLPRRTPQGLAGRAGRLAPDRPPAAMNRATVRAWRDRMTVAGYVRGVRLLGRTWTAATARGLALAGLPGKPWGEAESRLGHLHAAAVVRLECEQAPGAVWVSERELRSAYEQAREAAGGMLTERRPDGVLTFPDGRRVGIEVELSRKQAAEYEAIVREQDTSLTEVWWFTRPADAAWLERALQNAGAAGHRVAPLPAGAVP